MIEWNAHRWTCGRPVRCIASLRKEYRGRPLKPATESLQGKELLLQAMWQCEKDENYPDEFALEGADEATRTLLKEVGIAWIASGDVTPQEPFEHQVKEDS